MSKQNNKPQSYNKPPRNESSRGDVKPIITLIDTELDKILANLMDYSFDYGAGKIPMSENPPLLLARTAKKAIISLIEKERHDHEILVNTILDDRDRNYIAKKDMEKIIGFYDGHDLVLRSENIRQRQRLAKLIGGKQ